MDKEKVLEILKKGGTIFCDGAYFGMSKAGGVFGARSQKKLEDIYYINFEEFLKEWEPMLYSAEEMDFSPKDKNKKL